MIKKTLPTELFIKIFNFLDKKSKAKCCRISKEWNNILYTPLFWSTLTLSNKFSMNTEKTKESSSNAMTKYPNISDEKTSRSILSLLIDSKQSYRFSNLKTLELSYTDIDLNVFMNPYIINLLSNNLTMLFLDGCVNVSSDTLIYLRELKSLKTLDISHCNNVDDDGLEVISKFNTSLTSLNLSYLYKITELGLQKLFRIPGLVTINILGCYRIRSYPWAKDKKRTNISPIKELMIGEDARIQSGGFWLLWCW